MYAKLFQNTPSFQALTDDTKYPCPPGIAYSPGIACPSLPIPGPAFSMYEEPVIHNREYFQPPRALEPTFQPAPPPRTPLFPSSRTAPSIIPSGVPSPMPSAPPTEAPHHEDNLLPVLDCRFNLREICKQSILLEDHLSHDKKRCTDCCIKHFLALEGLCEEAVTLDKENQHKDLQGLAEKIRKIQKTWYEDPSGNSHQCSQELRKIRKEFMMDVFPMIFESSGKCGDGVCTFAPRSK